MDHIAAQPTTAYHKKGNRADLRKCMFCRRDKQKCEVTIGEYTSAKRKWPGQKCDRCIKYNYACSANYNAKEEPKCTFCRQNREQCFPPHRSWPGQRCNRCEHYGDPCGVGLTASEDKQVRRHQRNREGSAVERLAVQDALILGLWNDQSDKSTIKESSGSATPYAMQQIPTAVAPTVQYNLDYQCPPVSGILETSNPENVDIAQGAGLGSWIGMLDSEYHAATLPVQEIQPKEADLHFPLDSFADATYIHSDRSNSEDTSAFGSPSLALSVTPSALPCELQSVSLGSPPDQGSTVVRHSSSWNPLDVAACFSSMQWTEYVPTTEYEPFASSCSTFGVPIFSLKMKPSDQTMRNAMEFKLDQRMAILYGDPCTYAKVCSRKFGNTLAEWYREDVRQLAHCGYLMVKHALFACMAADSLITYRKLEKKRKQFGGDLTPEESHFRDQYRHAFEKYYRSAFHLLEASMEEYKSPASSGSLPAKPLLYTCYLLGVAVVCTNQPMVLYQIYMWFIELERSSGAFPFALVVPQKQKDWGVILRLPPGSDGTIHELEVGRDLSALCRQRWRYDSWARL